MDINQPLHEDLYYHIYNRGNNGDNIFYEERNYKYFLKQYDRYLSNYIETYAYCLLPNHFHLLVRVKPYNIFPKRRGQGNIIPLKDGIADRPEFRVSEQFRRMFITYSQAINKQQTRTGSLFQKPFKRKEVAHSSYFSNLIYYIHANPQNHGICDDFKEYKYSSYGRILIDKPSKLFKEEVLKWFAGKDHFIDFHKQGQRLLESEHWAIDE